MTGDVDPAENPMKNGCKEAEEPMDVTEGGDTKKVEVSDGPEEMQTDTNGIDMDQDEESRGEATFEFTVHNIAKMKEQALSPACIIRSIPWKILVMPRATEKGAPSLGVFVQCNGMCEGAWSCLGTAAITIKCQVGPNSGPEGSGDVTRTITHLFNQRENDWGYSSFMSMADLLEPSKGLVSKNDTIVIQCKVTADAPHGVSWDSKKHTGFVGLKNQGATCYMNSLLQTLFFTNAFRKAVYEMPTEKEDSSKSVALALQRVFYDLQSSDKAVGTKRLTKSFGWDSLDSFMQHDVQELSRVLLDNVEDKMKGTVVEGTIPQLFKGELNSYIKCKHVDYTSDRTEAFYDIQLNIKGCKDVYGSFDDYVSTEALEGDNKYDAGDHGLQDAEKGVRFVRFPPVLHLQLMRFQFDAAQDTNVKINDRYEYPEKLSLDKYLVKPEDTPAAYRLHAVLVHSGDNHGGHYVVYINPQGDGKTWCKFDDDVVSRCGRHEAIDKNFGGPLEEDFAIKQSSNAYMLVYIRESMLPSVLKEVPEEQIPKRLMEKLEEDKNLEALKRKERNEAHLYMTANVVLVEDFEKNDGLDLCDLEKVNRMFRVKKDWFIGDFLEVLGKNMNLPVESLRLWYMLGRDNGTFRPTSLTARFEPHEEVKETDKCIYDLAGKESPYHVFLEVARDKLTGAPAKLPVYDRSCLAILFIKYFDPHTQTLSFLCHQMVNLKTPVDILARQLATKAGIPQHAQVAMYEEIQPGQVEEVPLSGDAVSVAVDELMDGDLLIIQEKVASLPKEGLHTTAKSYLMHIHMRLELTFVDKNHPDEEGFSLMFMKRTSFSQVMTAVGQHLEMDPYMLQFFHVDHSYGKDVAGYPIKYDNDMLMRDYCGPKQPKKMMYLKLEIPINMMHIKRQMKCMWVDDKLREEHLVVYPDKDGHVGDLFKEEKIQQRLSPNGTHELRLLEVQGGRIHGLIKPGLRLDSLTSNAARSFRIEEIPKDHQELAGDEFLLPVGHFNQEVASSCGVPFLHKIKDKEPYTKVKEGIREKMGLSEKEFEKCKLVSVSQGMQSPIDENSLVQRQDFPVLTHATGAYIKTWLGVNHANKPAKRSRPNYLEKAIKIHN